MYDKDTPMLVILGLIGLMIAVTALISVHAWMQAIWYARGRFSLRALLIATTLVAVALGLGVWAAS